MQMQEIVSVDAMKKNFNVTGHYCNNFSYVGEINFTFLL